MSIELISAATDAVKFSFRKTECSVYANANVASLPVIPLYSAVLLKLYLH